MYDYKATFISNYDGDTAKFKVDLGFEISYEITVRFLRIDTPELRSKDPIEKSKAYEAKYFVETALTNAKEIYLLTHKDKKGKYGRYLAEVMYDSVNLNDELLSNGLAKLY